MFFMFFMTVEPKEDPAERFLYHSEELLVCKNMEMDEVWQKSNLELRLTFTCRILTVDDFPQLVV